MQVVVHSPPPIALIEPHYPKTSKKGGRPPYSLATMLRIHLQAPVVFAQRSGDGRGPDRGFTMRRFPASI
jgi:hypothetical protein